jgi:hypothetical protein
MIIPLYITNFIGQNIMSLSFMGYLSLLFIQFSIITT